MAGVREANLNNKGGELCYATGNSAETLLICDFSAQIRIWPENQPLPEKCPHLERFSPASPEPWPC